MNTFEVAVLRILIKRQQPIKLSILVTGFPDDCEDSVLSAISNLKVHGYIQIDDYQPNGDVSINSERRKEVLQIVDSHILYPHNFDTQHPREKLAPAIREKRGFFRIVARYRISQGSRAITISLLLILGIVSALGMSMPATSPDTEFVAHHQFAAYKKWAGSGGMHGENEREGGGTIPSSSYAPPPASFVALKDCGMPQSEQQT